MDQQTREAVFGKLDMGVRRCLRQASISMRDGHLAHAVHSLREMLTVVNGVIDEIEKKAPAKKEHGIPASKL